MKDQNTEKIISPLQYTVILVLFACHIYFSFHMNSSYKNKKFLAYLSISIAINKRQVTLTRERIYNY